MQLQEQIVDRWQEQLDPIKPVGGYLDQLEVLRESSGTPIGQKSEEIRERFLGADGQRPTKLEQEAIRGTNDLLDVNFLDRCILVSKAIGRIEARSSEGRIKATGFLIAPGLLMTNHHVLSNAEIAGTGSVEFGLRYNVAGELGQTTRFAFDPDTFFVADERLDYAVVAVSPESMSGRESIVDFSYLTLHPESGKVLEREFVTIIQHPDGEPLQIALRENQVSAIDPEKPYIQYEADTAHGSSGAPVFNDSLQIAALHSGGRIRRNGDGEFVLRNGKTVRSLTGITESEVEWDANAGIRVSFICSDLLEKTQRLFPQYIVQLQQAMAGGDILARAVVAARTTSPLPLTEPMNITETIISKPMNNETKVDVAEMNQGTNQIQNPEAAISIPLVLRVHLEDPRATAVQTAPPLTSIPAPREKSAGSELEKEAWRMQVPIIYDGLNQRSGYDPDFLTLSEGRVVKLPELTASGNQIVAKMTGTDDHILRYHKFSVVMHKERRLALFTASNVDWDNSHRLINGRKPSRKELSGIPDNVLEQWMTDSRISPHHQLPDRFFTEDRQAFDKGHLVRRDDVCWGTTFEDIQKANGDTYHVTNCSPQINKFNQATMGDFNWGDFENEVQKKTKKEKVIIFAGPVLDQRDRWFRGVDDQGAVRAQIPSRYWKIVVSASTGNPEAFGFIFDQDVVSVTEKEFSVSPQWKHASMAISEIESLLRGWVDLTSLKEFDTFRP